MSLYRVQINADALNDYLDRMQLPDNCHAFLRKRGFIEEGDGWIADNAALESLQPNIITSRSPVAQSAAQRARLCVWTWSYAVARVIVLGLVVGGIVVGTLLNFAETSALPILVEDIVWVVTPPELDDFRDSFRGTMTAPFRAFGILAQREPSEIDGLSEWECLWWIISEGDTDPHFLWRTGRESAALASIAGAFGGLFLLFTPLLAWIRRGHFCRCTMWRNYFFCYLWVRVVCAFIFGLGVFYPILVSIHRAGTVGFFAAVVLGMLFLWATLPFAFAFVLYSWVFAQPSEWVDRFRLPLQAAIVMHVVLMGLGLIEIRGIERNGTSSFFVSSWFSNLLFVLFFVPELHALYRVVWKRVPNETESLSEFGLAERNEFASG